MRLFVLFVGFFFHSFANRKKNQLFNATHFNVCLQYLFAIEI